MNMGKYIEKYLKDEAAIEEEYQKRKPISQDKKFDLSFCGTNRERREKGEFFWMEKKI